MAFNLTQTAAEIQDILDLAQLRIAAPYDAGTSYIKGDYCTKDDGFYVANASTSGTWDGSKWDAVTVGDVLTSINTNLTQSPTAPTAYSSRAGTIEGGYIRIGNVVIVAVRFIALTANSSAAVYLQGLPRPNATIVLTGGLPNNNANVFSYVNANGQIGLGAVSANTQATVMGVYLAS